MTDKNLIEKLLRELYDPSLAGNCIEYLEGLKKFSPCGYGDTSLKEYWERAVALVEECFKEKVYYTIDDDFSNVTLGTSDVVLIKPDCGCGL